MTIVTGIFQIGNLVGALVILTAIVLIARRWPDTRLLLGFPALWAVFGVAFYLLVFSDRMTAPALQLWSAVYRFVTMVMILASVVALWAIMTEPPDDIGNDDDIE